VRREWVVVVVVSQVKGVERGRALCRQQCAKDQVRTQQQVVVVVMVVVTEARDAAQHP
jgi:hypothetical protein